MELKKVGAWWNDKSIEIFEIDGRRIALYGWNGEKYLHCFEVDKTLHIIIKEEIEVLPIYEDFKNGDVKIIDYIIIGE